MVGAGAIGGLLGAWLSRSGVETTALARGATLESLQRSGWRVRETDGSLTTAPVTAAASAAEPRGARRRGGRGEGAVAGRAGASPGTAGRAGHGGAAGDERRAVVVHDRARWPGGRPAAAVGRPGRRDRRGPAAGAGRRLRGAPRREHRRAGPRRARVGAPADRRRTRGLGDAAAARGGRPAR
nr:2-dehydropantoate 2-reductase N-terminal domain-containing protein [Angustibacter aerolatus]